MLGFFNGREQYEVLIVPGQGRLMFNQRDIYWLINNERRLSDTINNAIEIWLSPGGHPNSPTDGHLKLRHLS